MEAEEAEGSIEAAVADTRILLVWLGATVKHLVCITDGSSMVIVETTTVEFCGRAEVEDDVGGAAGVAANTKTRASW